MNTSIREYCDVADVENYLLITVEEYFLPQVRAWIRSVSRQFDTMANRKLVVEEIGSGDDYPFEYYDGNAGRKLLINDCHDIQSVEVDDAEVEYDPYPKAEPHYALIGSWPKGEQNVKVTANFGYFGDVPDDLRFATAVAVAGIINATQNKTFKKSESIGNYSVTYSDEKGFADFQHAMTIVDGYRRITF